MKLFKLASVITLALAFVGCDSDPKVARQKYLETGMEVFFLLVT